ncbi:hypothetical protein EVAR_100318_1 [Eumeta japonica]|uniref:Uncharacterized protein n=1 Tax=Eumeta variegata TaxID=151549 RepID=A0A4C1ZMD2_EUMVA|nr:hypothetical protein EVAR_100318_1 [Eumeta japonica]
MPIRPPIRRGVKALAIDIAAMSCFGVLDNKEAEIRRASFIFVAQSKGERASVPSQSRYSPQPVDTRNPRGVISTLPVYPIRRSRANRIFNGGDRINGGERRGGLPELSLAGQNSRRKLLLHIRIL